MVKDVKTLKAMWEPILMRPMRQAIIVVAMTEIKGIEVRLSTYTLEVNKGGLLACVRENGVVSYPANIRPEWQTTVTSKSPDRTRGCSNKADDCEGTKASDDGGHCCASGNGAAGGLQKYLHERVACARFMDGLDVPEAEQDCRKHTKAEGAV